MRGFLQALSAVAVLLCVPAVLLAQRGPIPGQARTEHYERVRVPANAASGPVAVALERFERNGREIRVYRGERPVERGQFMELLVVSPADPKTGLPYLVGEKIALVPAKQRGRWDVFTNVGWSSLDLPANVFCVRNVLRSTERVPLEVRVDGEVHRLKAGQALLVIG